MMQVWEPALTNLPLRAERNSDQALKNTFVEVADLSRKLMSPENQILYGRRGTGKTHALANLRQRLLAKGDKVVGVDLRTIGSAGDHYLATPDGRGLAAVQILVDLLAELHSELYASSIELLDAGHDVTALVRAMDQLAEAATSVAIDGTVEVSSEISDTASQTDRLGAGVSLAGGKLDIGYGSQRGQSSKSGTSASGTLTPDLNLSAIRRAIQGVINALPGGRLWLLVDEWSAVPLDVQPVIADFIRRALLPCRGLTLKIAAVERRSIFWQANENGYIGLELGADIFAGLDLDRFLSATLKATDPDASFYATMVARHVEEFYREANEDPGRLGGVNGLRDAFPAFQEAVYLTAGVPRDLLIIVGTAASQPRPQFQAVGHADLLSACRAWFLQEKATQARLKTDTRRLAAFLRVAAEEGERRFLLDHNQRIGAVDDLHDQRIVHLLDRGVGPGGKFDIFALDIGLYADLLPSDGQLQDKDNPWANWDHVKSSHKGGRVLESAAGRLQWMA